METRKSKICCGGMSAILVLGMIAPTTKADFAFGEPTSLGPTVNSSAIDGHASISADGLSLFFYSERSAGGYGGRDIWVATRATIEEDWTSVENVGPPVNTPYRESAPSISADGLMLFFDSDRPGGSGGRDIWATTRETKDAPWTTPVNLGSTVNSSVHDYYSSVSADGLVLFFDVGLEDPSDNVWMTTRDSRDEAWTPPVILEPLINSSWGDGEARISPDGLALFFASTRPGGYGSGWNLWVAMRATADGDWGTPVNLGPTINDPSGAAGAIISADGSTLYFTSPRSGTIDLWQAPIIHIMDFNGDGSVDGADVRTMADRWGTDDPVCDIGPMPWSDGIITDAAWHRVGVTWDGASRRLYVDGVLVAEDTQDGLADSPGGLILGCGKNMTSDTFWSGLIDDVRIYNRAVEP